MQYKIPGFIFLLSSILLTGIEAVAMDIESMLVLRRGVWPEVFDVGDSLIEKSTGGITFIVSDTLCQTSRRVRTPWDTISLKTITIPTGNNWFQVFAMRHRSGAYGLPFLYQFNRNDTGYVEERFREVNLDRRAQLIDAKLISGGDYLVIYRLGDDMSPTYAARITPEGERVWATEILPIAGQWTYAQGIEPRTDDSAMFYIYGLRRYWDPHAEDDTLRNRAFVIEIDTSGGIIWHQEYLWAFVGEGFTVEVSNMHVFDDGTLAIVGTTRSYPTQDQWERFHFIQYMHLSSDGDSLETFDYHKGYYHEGTYSTVYGGNRLLIFSEYNGMGLLYINEQGDSLDGCFFNLDTVGTNFGPIIVRPDRKVMCWSNTNFQRDRLVDVLISFYPDGRPDAVVEPELFTPPSGFALIGAYPNPFNSVANIRYDLPEAGDVRLGIYDMSGREVAMLAEGKIEAGRREVVWDACDLAAGVYVIRLKSGPSSVTRKVVFMK